MCLLYDNAAMVSIAAVCSALAWLYGGTIASALYPAMPWLVALMLEFSLFFPQRRPGETTFEARQRVWDEMKSDKLTWISIAFLAILTVPFFNTALCPCCNYPEINFDGARQAAPVPFIPYCVDRLEHLNVFTWFMCALPAAVAAKHALLRHGKRNLIALIVWNGVGLSAIGMIQYATGAENPLWSEGTGKAAYFFSTFGYPNMAGDYFTTLFALAVALWRWNVDEVHAELHNDNDRRSHSSHTLFWRKHLMLIPAALFFFSAMMTLSRASIMFVTVLAIVFFVHSFATFIKRMSRARRVKAMTANFLVLILIGTFFAVFISGRESMLEKSSGSFRADLNQELSSIGGREVLDRVSGKGQYHVRVATKVWLDNILFGCGGWGYKHFCVPKMTDSDFAKMQKIGGINVHNDYIQFLAEHGLAGFALIVGAFLTLVWPIGKTWKTLANAVRFAKPKERPPSPVSLFALPASVFYILCAAVSTLIHSFADCPLRSPAVLSLFFVSLAAADGFLPHLHKKSN